MKIYAYLLEDDGSVYSVRSCEGSKMTDQEIIDKVKKLNEKAGREAYKLYDIPEEMEEVIRFLLGEKKYKRYADIDDIDDSINELSADITNLYDAAYDLNHGMEQIQKMFEELKENIKKE